MVRALAALDVFSALADPRRRQVLDLLAAGEQPVTDLVRSLGWPQPQVSKHLGVLRKVGLVSVRPAGRRRVYALNARQLEPIYAWVKKFERFWDYQLDQIKKGAERKVPGHGSSKGRST
jgi:DNA-binding transcriptional ArsR family regulator